MLFTVLERVYVAKDRRHEFEVVSSKQSVDDAIAEADQVKGEVRVTVDLDRKFGEEQKHFTPIRYSEAIRQQAVRDGTLRVGDPADVWHGLREYAQTATAAMKRAIQNKVPGAFHDYMMQIDEETRQRRLDTETQQRRIAAETRQRTLDEETRQGSRAPKMEDAVADAKSKAEAPQRK